jgi:hypothetical protein
VKKTVLFIALILLVSIDLSAQCSMCSAVVESSEKSGSEIGQGLNAGILYLMGIPYALLLGMGFLLFRKLNQNKSENN